MGIDVNMCFPVPHPVSKCKPICETWPLPGTNNSKRRAPPYMHPGCETWSMEKMEKKTRVQYASHVYDACMRTKKGTPSSEHRSALPLGALLALARVFVQPLDEPLLVLVGQVRHAVVYEIKTAPRG